MGGGSAEAIGAGEVDPFDYVSLVNMILKK